MTLDDKLARLESLMIPDWVSTIWPDGSFHIGGRDQFLIAQRGPTGSYLNGRANAELITNADLIPKLARALRDCADGLANAVENEYAATRHYPVMEMKFQRDMEPVNRARALLAELDGRLP